MDATRDIPASGGGSLPPGPRLPAALQTLRFLTDEVALLERCRRRYGDAFTLRVSQLGALVVLGHPEDVRRVLTQRDAHAGEARAVLHPLVGSNSILLLDGDPHLHQRRMMLPPFHGDALEAYVDVIRDLADRELDAWPLGAPVATRPPMQTITLRVILRAVFGLGGDRREREVEHALRRMMALGMPLVGFPLLQRDLGPLSPSRRFARRRRRVVELLEEEIAHRARDPHLDERSDVLSAYLLARARGESALTDAELRDELLTLLIAGHDTTATALAWCLERLVHEPEVLRRAREEVHAGETSYVDAVAKETLRTRPVLSFGMRALVAPVEVAGHELPEGTTVAGSFHLAHHHPDAFPDPYAFRPERFLDGRVDPVAWLPFGVGMRRCVGASFALVEMRVVLETILRRARIAAADGGGGERRKRRAVSLAPARDARVLLLEREPARSAVPA